MRNPIENIIKGVVLAAVITGSSAVAASQTPRPTPPDDDEIPVVVSRDEPEIDVNEIAPTPTPVVRTRAVPAPTDDALELLTPKSVASPYSIKLSEAQQKMMLYLDILTRTEARAELLRSRLFEMIEKENTLGEQIRQIDYNLRPDQIQNAAILSGSLRPEDVREERKKYLEASRRSSENLLNQIALSRLNLEKALKDADALVERVRSKFEQFVDEAMDDDLDLQD